MSGTQTQGGTRNRGLTTTANIIGAAIEEALEKESPIEEAVQAPALAQSVGTPLPEAPPAAAARIGPAFIEDAPQPMSYEEAIEQKEPMYTVRSVESFQTVIANERFEFKANKPVRVRKTVRDILARARKIYPGD